MCEINSRVKNLVKKTPELTSAWNNQLLIKAKHIYDGCNAQKLTSHLVEGKISRFSMPSS